MDKNISNLGLGGASITSLSSFVKAKRLIETAIDLGVTHFDTAPIYGKGYSEIVLGKILKNKRKDITITTKFGLGEPFATNKLPVEILMPLNYIRREMQKKILKRPVISPVDFANLPYRKLEKKELVQSFTLSLKRLQTDYVDYYLIHENVPQSLTDEALSYLMQLKKNGQIRYLGIGINFQKLLKLENSDLQEWDILQYEGYNDSEVKLILNKWPDKMHFFHSCLKSLTEETTNKSYDVDRAGYLMAQCIKRFPAGKVIFSTRALHKLRSNIQSFSKFTAV